MKFLLGVTIFISLILAVNFSVAPSVTQNDTKKVSEEKQTEPELLQIYDIDEGYLWVPYVKNVKHHNYDWKNLRYENGYLKYEDSKYISKLGIDVSYYQGEIEWNKVKQAGIEFVIIRLGYRGYGNGRLVVDSNFHKYIQGAIEAGLEIGVYFFSQAVNEQEAIEEAEFVLSNVQQYNIAYPVCFDTEKIKNDTYRAENLSINERTNITIVFCKKIEEAGYVPMIYANAKWLTTALDLQKLQEYKVWYADYQEAPIYPYNFTMWQYTETGKVDGIKTNADINLYFKEK